MTVENALQSVGRSCLAHLLRNEPAVLASTAEGIHQMRVATSTTSGGALRPQAGDPVEQYRWVLEELKWLAGTLGAARIGTCLQRTCCSP